MCSFSSEKSDKKASFSINDSRKISKFCSSHTTPIVNDYTVYNKSRIFVQPDRLNPWDANAYSIVRTLRINEGREEKSKNFSRLAIGHKSNRLPVLNSAAARLGQAGRETQDVLQRDNLEATASVINCVGGTNGDLPTEMTTSDTDDVVAVLQGNSAEYITNMIEAENKFSTSAIGDSYGCMLTSRMIPVLNNMAGFTRKQFYPNQTPTLASEWGGVNNIRFFQSEQGSVSPNASLLGNDVANCFVAAKESYKIVKMLDDLKSSLIDLETWDYAIAA